VPSRVNGHWTALVFPVLLLFLVGMVDIGRAAYGRARLNSAVSAGAHYAYLIGPTVTGANVKAMIEGLADSVVSGVSQVVATVANPACYCVGGAPGGVTMTAATCNTACPDTSLAGTYVLINATYTFTPVLPAISNLVPSTMASTAVVQLR
jgi:Flp pilus assembly protein TadG